MQLYHKHVTTFLCDLLAHNGLIKSASGPRCLSAPQRQLVGLAILFVQAVLECRVCLSAWRPVDGVSPALSQGRPPSKGAPCSVPPSDLVPSSQRHADPPTRGRGGPMRAVNQRLSPGERDVSPWEEEQWPLSSLPACTLPLCTLPSNYRLTTERLHP